MVIYTNLRDLTPEFQQYRLERVNQDAAFERACEAIREECASYGVTVEVKRGKRTQVRGATAREKRVAMDALKHAQFDL